MTRRTRAAALSRRLAPRPAGAVHGLQPLARQRSGRGGSPTPALGRGPNLLQVHRHPERTIVQSGRFLAPADEPLHDPLLLQLGTDECGDTREPHSRRRPVASPRGQALVEFALVFPLFLLVLFSVISFGLYIFYNQQLANAAREAARYAAVHSSTAHCPTVSNLDPPQTLRPSNDTYSRCDAPEGGWPNMVSAAPLEGLGHGPVAPSRWRPAGRATSTRRTTSMPSPSLRTCSLIARSTASIRRRTRRPRLSGAADDPSGSHRPRRPTGTTRPATWRQRSARVAPIPTTVTVYACFKWKPADGWLRDHPQTRSRSAPWSPKRCSDNSRGARMNRSKPRIRTSPRHLRRAAC